MKEASPDSLSFPDRIRSWANTHAHGSPLTPGTRRTSTLNSNNAPTDQSAIPPFPSSDINGFSRASNTGNDGAADTPATSPQTASPSQAEGEGTVIDPATEDTNTKKPKKNVAVRFYLTGKEIILSSWINVLLVFVPIGIAADAAHLSPTIVFAMNAVAIIPLAGLLSHATESVAKRLGDTVGALMNVTFGNAVELIIFIIALVKNEIRIVQASLLGSILSNLLLILGMCFLIGGLRFREQIYNSTVTQMSACLLSLSVMSLLLPTAFHASFTDTAKADSAVLQVSRGTSIILLLVYGMYLLFQLKSHAYMYESTPQHIIDEESAPGPVAAWMDSSSDDSDSSSSSDSDASSGSNTTAKRFKRVMRGGRRRRKSSTSSKHTVENAIPTRSPSLRNGSVTGGASDTLVEEPSQSSGPAFGHRFGALENEEAVIDRPAIDKTNSFSKRSEAGSRRERKHRKKQEKKAKKARKAAEAGILEKEATGPATERPVESLNEPRRVDFALNNDIEAQNQDAMASKRPFTLRGLSIRPAIPNVFTSASPAGSPHLRGVNTPPQTQGPIPRVRYGIRRTNSLPDRLGQPFVAPNRVGSAGIQPVSSGVPTISPVEEEDEENISRTTAIVLLLISTGLVALCAEFMVDSINEVVSTTGISEAFVGLIILPIVGNAAEHVTAVTVASKNKMDLAIGVAVGSSIQIALFVTPLVILLGWILDKEMSLYFTLFETVSLFVSAFIVNFLVLDGRSNYLEGALLCAAYIIIALAAYFYPDSSDASVLGGNSDAAVETTKMMARMVGWSA